MTQASKSFTLVINSGDVEAGLTAPKLTLAAPALAAGVSRTTGLPSPEISLAAPAVAAMGDTQVKLTTPTVGVSVSTLTPAYDGTVALTTPGVSLDAPVVDVYTFVGSVVELPIAEISLAAPGLNYGEIDTIVNLTTPSVTLEAPQLSNPMVHAYVTNLCTNPSFEVDLTGWAAAGGATIAQDDTQALVEQESMLVTTPGNSVGEGFTGPTTTSGSADTTGAISFSVYPYVAGTVNVDVITPAGMVLASTLATLSPGAWQTVTLQNFTVPAGTTFELYVTTNSPQALMFWVDAVQYELGVTAASTYVDGDMLGATWEGSPGLSESVLEHENATGGSGGMVMSGQANQVVIGAQSQATASGAMVMSGDCAPTVTAQAAMLTDFAIFELTDPDPAMTYVDQNNAGAEMGTDSWVQSYGIFYPPLDYQVGGNKYLWTRAAFMGIGFYATSVQPGGKELFTDFQVQLAPYTGSTPELPAAFTPPRQIATIIQPTRLNYCPNPSFEVDTSSWAPVAGAGTPVQDPTTVPPQGYNTLSEIALDPYLNSTGISDDGVTGYGNFDGTGNTYSSEQLAAGGFGSGAEVVAGGIDFLMPGSSRGSYDNILAAGQTITVSPQPDATYVAFLGAGSTSGAAGTVTFKYADGSTPTTQPLSLTEWTSSTISNGNGVAGQLAYYNTSDGQPGVDGSGIDIPVYLFTAILPLESGKTLASIELPASSDPSVSTGIHIFGISMAETSGPGYGSNSCKVPVTATAQGVSVTIPDLIVGDTYIASMYVQPGPYLSDIAITGTTSATVIDGQFDLNSAIDADGTPYGGPPDYGEGYYGGLDPSLAGAPLPTGVWYRMYAIFTALADTATLNITVTTANGFNDSSNFWVDAVLVEAGETLGTYFDGSFGSAGYLDYQWEANGTPGATRSYYYEQLAVKQFTIQEILDQHVPLGLTAAAPQYLVPPTQ